MPAVSTLSVLALLNVASSLLAADASTNSPILANLSFDQLSQIKIVTVSQRLESLANAAAAVRVVTSEDIARSGATSIPEALRYVPGLNVAQINGSAWAIGARGFQDQYANKLLVMVDGVSVYSPVTAGVFWDQQNYFLADLQQMEVVLGPGGSIWGANAMNGVINVITKSARDTQGGEIYGGGGSEKAAMAGARYGWLADTNLYARVYGIYNYNDPTKKPGGGDAPDATSSGQGGFRLDGYPHDSTEWTLKGDVRWAGNNSILLQPELALGPDYVYTNHSPSRIFGGQLLGHWQSELSPDSTLQFQAYYDLSQRQESIEDASVHTADVQLHHTWSGWQRQVIDWGLDGRMVYLDTRPSWATFYPAQESDWLGSGFVQDEISLVPDDLLLTGGIKLEEHSTGTLMPQPTARLTWHPAEHHTIWAAWSQALRSPEATEMNAQIDAAILPTTPDPTVLRYSGNAEVKPEELQAWELGWRWQGKQLTLDVDGYYYQYRNLIMVTKGDIQNTPPVVVVPFDFANAMAGDAYGGEIVLKWQPAGRWFASAGYCVEHMSIHAYLPDPINSVGAAMSSPRQSVSLTSGLKLGRGLELTGALRYLDNIPNYNIPAYFELDAQLTWRPCEHWEFSLTGQNLLQDQHLEYQAALPEQTAEIPRGVYAKVTWKF